MSGGVAGQVMAANRAFYHAFEALDLEALLALWHDGPDIACLHPGGPWQRGPDEVRAGWEAILENTRYIEFALAEERVWVADPMAWVTLVERITAPGGRGERTATADVAATNAFLLGERGWRMVLHHASPVIREAPASDAEGLS